MAYQVLARKWRPQGFDDVTGQSHVTTPLRNAIRSDRVPHAILLTGPRGVGKTTLARILARCLNCDKGPTDTPCGECSPCREIAAGTSTDVQEIDAASRTSVDDVRELIAAIRYAAAPGKYRIFVVDEVHMLSTAAFNALLKTLEEPPPRSLFVFATTNPEKIPFTVVSRCQRYDLRRIAAAEIVARLQTMVAAEKVTISESSLLAIAREADGSMRDAQTLLDQVIAYGGSEISDDQVAQVLDLIDRRVILAILEACVDGDPAAALASCGRADTTGTDAKRLSEHLIQGLRDLVVLRIAPDHPELVEASADDVEELRQLAARTDATRLRRMFRALVKEQEDLAWAPQPFAVLEMAVVRLATLPEADEVARLLQRLEHLERRLAGGAGGAGPASGSDPASEAGGGRRPGRTRRRAPERGATSAAGAATDAPAASAAGAATDAPATSAAGAAMDAPATSAAGAATDAPATSAAGAATDAPATSAAGAAMDAPATSAAGAATDAPATSAAGAAMDAPATSAAGAAMDAPATSAPPDGASLATVFDRLRAFVRQHNPGIYAALDGGRLLARDEGSLRIGLSAAFAARRLREKSKTLDALASRFFGAPVRVEVVDESGPAAAERSPAPGRDASRRRRQEALNDPGVSRALEILGGEIVEIRPLGDSR